MSEMSAIEPRPYPSPHEPGSALARRSEWWGGSASVSEPGWGVLTRTAPTEMPPTRLALARKCAAELGTLPTASRGEGSNSQRA